MKIRSQFIISLIIFGIILLVTVASVILTSQQTANLSAQQEVAARIQRGATNLNYLSNYYFLYQESLQLDQWHSAFNSLSDDLSSLKLSNPAQQTLINILDGDLQNLNSVFENVVSYLQNAPRNVSVRIDPQFQTQWSRMALQNQGLASDASQLSQAITYQADQLNVMSTALVFVLFGTFGVYFLAIYLLIYRRALNSISNLQAETKIIGEGNLDHRIKIDRQDEIGELSEAFNQMTANLKTVTTCKEDLENEVAGRKLAETALRASEERWSTTLSSIGDAVIATDVNGKVTFMNGVAEELTGWTLSEVLQKPVKQAFNIVNEQTRREVEDPVAKVLEKGLIIGLANHTILLRKDGSELPIDDSGAPIKDKEGKITGVVLVFRDITERKRVQGLLEDRTAQVEEYAHQMEQLANERAQKLKDAERLAAIGATAGMVGHDIRNPLQAIIGDVYLAKGDVNSLPQDDSKTSLQESLTAIEKNIEYINKIVADLQDFARPLNPRVEKIDLNSIINDLLTKNGIPDNIKRRVKIAKETQTLTTDPAYLKRILGNLISNAIQAMPEGGRLTINTTGKDDNTVITVQDTGVGIPENVKPKLFQPLFTTKSKGQGFGLPVVKRMTEALNGTVTFQSETGKGTKFIIQIPTNNKK
jgi:PAS domain S-box-containing protein